MAEMEYAGIDHPDDSRNVEMTCLNEIVHLGSSPGELTKGEGQMTFEETKEKLGPVAMDFVLAVFEPHCKRIVFERRGTEVWIIGEPRNGPNTEVKIASGLPDIEDIDR